MDFKLKEYIHRYMEEAAESDIKIARHLIEIIPKTTHMNDNIFNEIIEKLTEEMENGADFKTAFMGICEIYFLHGDVIKADLPAILTRVILNESKFFKMVKQERGIPFNKEQIKGIVDSKNRQDIAELFSDIWLTIGKVVFATFDEEVPNRFPFTGYKVRQIVNMLALDTNILKNEQPLNAVILRYKNRNSILKRFPVFPDVGWYDGFYPADVNDLYGRTRSLEPSLKDMPEVVHENLELADVIEDISFLKE